MSDFDALRSLLKRIMISDEHSDIVISCGEYTHRVHRAIISPQSEVLAAMCRGNFIEGKTGKIDLPDDDPEAINIMVQHLDGQSYQDARANSEASCEEDPAILDARVYAIADKYNIPSLKECAEAEFKAWAARSQRTEPWAHVVEEIWKGNEFSGLHIIIEEQVAEDIDQMLEDDWLSFIDRGMKLGRFSAAFLLRIVKKKNAIFYTERDQNVRQQFKICDLKSRIKGYKQVIDDLGEKMRVDAYDSDESSFVFDPNI